MHYKTITTILLGVIIMTATSSNAEKAAKHDPLSLDNMITAADKLTRTQSLMSWDNRTKGSPVDFESTYKGYEWLFTHEAISFVARKINETGISDDERLARSFFKDYLVMQHVDREVVSYDDRVTNLESTIKVRVPWLKNEVPYRELPILIAKENDAQKRKEIQALVSEVERDKLNPIIAERNAKEHEIIKSLGYSSYLDFSLLSRHVKNFRKIVEDADSFNRRTEGIYRTLLAEHARELLNIPVEKMRRSDLQKIFRLDSYVPYFPAEVMVPFLKKFLSGIGLTLETVDGHAILLDDEPRPKKEPRAACYNITVPADIRMTIAPQDGIGDYQALFHETGHALHFANTTVAQWAFKYLGDYAATESYASLLESRFSEPLFLLYYRDFIIEWNKNHPDAKQVPVLTDRDISKILRFGILNDLYFMRRYGGAKLVYESIYHGNNPKMWSNIYKGQTNDTRELYRVLFEKAYTFPMEETDAQRYLTDIDDYLYAIDYVRSFVISSQIDLALTRKFGNRWFENKNAGAYLKDKLFFAGDKLTGDDVVASLGFLSIDFNSYEKDIRTRLAESEKLLR